MKIILAVGAPGAGHEAVFSALTAAGVSTALPSRRDAHSPQEMTRLLLNALDVNSATQTPLEQVRPGKAWEELATDLVVPNLQQPAWGWADHQLAWVLDFWRDFDPQVRLLFVYSSPAEYLLARLGPKRTVGRPMLETALREWQEWNTSFLRYQLRNPQRCLLVNAQAALAKPAALVKLLQESWGVTGLGTAPAAAAEQDVEILRAQAARALIPTGHPARSLTEQLHNAAQLPAADSGDPVKAALASWNITCTFLADQEGKAAEARRLQELLDTRQQELDAALTLGREYEQLAAERSAEIDQLADQLAHPPAAASEELKRDNELLLLQLRQVQEELDLYFRQSQDLRQAKSDFVADFWRSHQPEVITLDMRRPIAGAQWHAAEEDGRWSGPAALSTVDLPPLQPGSYMLEMDVIDAIAPDILEAAQIEVEGRNHALEIEYLGDGQGAFPAVCTANLRVADNGNDLPVRLTIRLPRTASASLRDAEDHRQLGVRVQELRVIRQLPGDALSE
jgi:hypothetical protein